MADKQPLNATFFAFKKRERGGVLLGTSIAYVAATIVIFGAFAALNWQAMSDYFVWASTMSSRMGTYDPSNPDAMMPPASVLSIFPAYVLFLFVYYLLFAAYEAACLKWMIRGESDGLFGLSLGADTWRVWAGYWIWFLLLIAAYVVCGIVAFVFLGSLFAIGSTGDPSAATSIGMIAPLLFLVILALVLFFAVRLAPAAATSVARRKFAFFDAWTVTKGRFWELLGAFAMLFVMYLVAVMILSFGIVMAIGMSAGSAAMNPNASQEDMMRVLASPQTIVPIVLIYLLIIAVAFTWILAMFGVNARAAAAALEEGKIAAAA
jgi:hypothetical protein